MDTISAKNRQSIYPAYDVEYEDIQINGVFLDELLNRLFPGREIRGLVPPFSGWLIPPHEVEELWNRVEKGRFEPTVLPLLICPDDEAFDCMTIVTETSVSGPTISWIRFGLNRSWEYNNAAVIGQDVDWFDSQVAFTFELEDYSEVFTNLKNKNLREAP